MNPQRNIIAQQTPCGDKRQRETQLAADWQQQQTISPTFTFHLPPNEVCGLSAAKNNYNGQQQQQERTSATAHKQIIC